MPKSRPKNQRGRRPKSIEFVPIRCAGSLSGYVALEIYPPGAWFDSKQFEVFVGGCGRASHRTRAAAEKRLLDLAIETCRERIAQAQAILDHYKKERDSLMQHGLQRQVTTMTGRSA